jgi:uncharacterized membrane protein (UPF0127 family)
VTNRRLLAVALVAVGAVVVVLGVVKLLSDSDSSGNAAANGSFATAIANASPANEPFPELTALRLAVGDRCIRLLVADSLDERVAGLRQRRDIGDYDGMLFVFDGAADVGFTMSTVPVPLDIGFYDADGKLVSTRHMKPCAKAENACPVYRSDEQFMYALETLKGKLPAGGISTCPS